MPFATRLLFRSMASRLIPSLQRSANELEDEISLRRTDLALFDFDAASHVLTCSLVEVKCYRAAGSLGGLSQLKTSIAEQIHQRERPPSGTILILSNLDPDRDRPDRMMKTQEFVNLLEFYIDRAHRLNSISLKPMKRLNSFFARWNLGLQTAIYS